jgi:2-dehydropantoate 2-reductase
MPSALILGAGAIGAFFGSALSRQGFEVSVVCRSDYELVKETGFHIRSPLLGEHRFKPTHVFSSAQHAGTEHDFVLLTTKVLEGEDRAAFLRPVVGERTVIVLIQNGIDIEAQIQDAFAANELLSAVAFIAVSRSAPGEIHHQSAGSLTLGRYPHGISAAAHQIASAFEAAGVPCKTTEDIVKARWQKALWNATFNPISIMGGVLDTAIILRTEEDRRFVRTAMMEIAAVAAAAGYAIAPEVIDKLIAATRDMPPYKSSMALDFENGRPMELEAIIGNVVRAAREREVAVPILDAIYRIAKMVEAKRDQSG